MSHRLQLCMTARKKKNLQLYSNLQRTFEYYKCFHNEHNKLSKEKYNYTSDYTDPYLPSKSGSYVAFKGKIAFGTLLKLHATCSINFRSEILHFTSLLAKKSKLGSR
jgi:hypothetical protein